MNPSNPTEIPSAGSESKKSKSKSTTAPRKRRRRIATTGAADDCFTCRKRQAKCDRKRPYCGPCLEIGNDCSGYKTTLTWGVGVASRGKLRGLTCPVAADKVDGDAGVTKKASVTQRRKSSVSRLASNNTKSGTTLPSPTSQMDKVEPDDFLLPLISPQQHLWQPSHQYSKFDSLALSSPDHDYTARPYGNLGYTNLSGFSQAPESVSWSDTSPTFPNNSFQDFVDHQNTNSLSQQSNLFPELDGNLSTKSGSGVDGGFDHLQQSPFTSIYDYGNVEHDDYMESNNNESGSHVVSMDDCQQTLDFNQELTLCIPRNIITSLFCHLTPRMQYLLDYYDKNICSVLVAFDDSINPYRMHILQLATQNEGLQNALAALSLNNMRMRLHKRPSPRGFIEELSDDHKQSEDDKRNSQPTPEEIYYKSMSIGKLQGQLTDRNSAQDDSVLAILLILCLFHVCDSGFSKFKTQLEGVQRLLSLRDPGVRTGFIGWVEMFFAWFDVMTSTVNDRETEIRGDRLDMLHYSSNLGALEQFSGCDGRLFKLIARLGRLNLLSQNRPVRSDAKSQWVPRAPPPAPCKSKDSSAFRTSKGSRTRKFSDPMDFSKLDGNSWGVFATSSDEEDASGVADDCRDPTDTRHEFWEEWHDIRSRLELWSMDQDITDPSVSISNTCSETAQIGPGQRDLIHINESFRSSALLYTERLAHPFLAASSPTFQEHVRTALLHIAALEITSCVNKFLLWPLFIAGTECVDLNDQALVRDRCVEIQIESGFFNNISVLDVLERVWADDVENEEALRRRDSIRSNGECGVQAFRWRKAMDRVDGEYIVV